MQTQGVIHSYSDCTWFSPKENKIINKVKNKKKFKNQNDKKILGWAAGVSLPKVNLKGQTKKVKAVVPIPWGSIPWGSTSLTKIIFESIEVLGLYHPRFSEKSESLEYLD